MGRVGGDHLVHVQVAQLIHLPLLDFEKRSFSRTWCASYLRKSCSIRSITYCSSFAASFFVYFAPLACTQKMFSGKAKRLSTTHSISCGAPKCSSTCLATLTISSISASSMHGACRCSAARRRRPSPSRRKQPSSSSVLCCGTRPPSPSCARRMNRALSPR